MSKKPAPPGKAAADGPPQTGGKDDGTSSAPPDPQTLPPDPQVMMYLQVAAVAFPRVQRMLTQQALAAQSTADANRSLATKLDVQTVAWVKRHMEERKEMELDLELMKSRKLELERQIVDQKKESEDAYFTQQVEQAKMLSDLRQQIHVLQADASEAADWEASRVRELKILQDTQTEMEDTKVTQLEEMKQLTEENETERRKLRDLLVRKLRRVRDVMSSATDDDDLGLGSNGNNGGTDDAQGKKRHHLMSSTGSANHGMLARDAESANLIAMFQTPTAKLNEKLSRAVTMYERESKSIAETIAQMHAATKASIEQLEEQREQNEKLVLRNASQTKAKDMLKAQLQELKKKYSRLSDSHEAHETERRRALQETVRTQGDVVSDLRGELEHSLNEYEGASSELASLERQLKARHKEAHEAHKFFAIVGSHHGSRTKSSDALVQAEAPPSGFVVDMAPNVSGSHDSQGPEVTGEPQGRGLTFTEAASRDLPGIPMLGLVEDCDIAWFFAGVLHRGGVVH
jgi:hypothetical protein